MWCGAGKVEVPVRVSAARTSLFAPLLFAVAAASGVWSWFAGGEVSYLISAFGFAALAPAGYFTPIAWRRSWTENEELAARIGLPRWAARSAILGVVLIAIALLMRWGV